MAGEQLEKAEPLRLQVRQGPWGRGSKPLTPTFLLHWGPECSLWGVPMGPGLCMEARVMEHRGAMLPPRKPPKFPGPTTHLEGAGPVSGAKGGGAGIKSLPTGCRRPGQLGAQGPPNKAVLQLRKPRHRGAEKVASAGPTACTQPQPCIGRGTKQRFPRQEWVQNHLRSSKPSPGAQSSRPDLLHHPGGCGEGAG